MAEFLTTVGTSYHIENIIKSAEDFLLLVSPYLKINKVLLERILDADKKDVKISIIYGKENLTKSEHNKINQLKNINIFFADNLHAKCYCNESQAIISSMNLYEFSERNNREMSILVNKRSERKIYQEILEEINSIKNNSVIEQQSFNSSLSRNNKKETELNSKEKRKLFISKISDMFLERYTGYKYKKSKDEFIIYDFPYQNISLTIDYILKFEFKLPHNILEKVRNEFRYELKNELEDYRCYWNSPKYEIWIYPSKDYNMGYQGNELIERTNYFLRAISITESFLINKKSYFQF